MSAAKGGKIEFAFFILIYFISFLFLFFRCIDFRLLNIFCRVFIYIAWCTVIFKGRFIIYVIVWGKSIIGNSNCFILRTRGIVFPPKVSHARRKITFWCINTSFPFPLSSLPLPSSFVYFLLSFSSFSSYFSLFIIYY